MPILEGGFQQANDFAGQQVVPMLFYPLNASAMTDGTQPGVLQPFRADEDGNLLVNIGGAGGGPLTIGDDVDDVAEVANDRVPTVARMYGLDYTTGTDWDRIRTDEDDDTASSADGLPALKVMGRNRVFNEFDGQWYLEHGQDSVDIAPSASRTVTTVFGNFVNANWRAAHFILAITAGAGFDLDFTLEGRSNNQATFYPLLVSAAGSLVATGTTVFKIGIGFTPIANLTANDLLPYIFRVTMTHNNASAVTYSIDSNLSV